MKTEWGSNLLHLDHKITAQSNTLRFKCAGSNSTLSLKVFILICYIVDYLKSGLHVNMFVLKLFLWINIIFHYLAGMVHMCRCSLLAYRSVTTIFKNNTVIFGSKNVLAAFEIY